MQNIYICASPYIHHCYYVKYLQPLLPSNHANHIGGVMVSVFALSVAIKLVFVTSPLSMQH